MTSFSSSQLANFQRDIETLQAKIAGIKKHLWAVGAFKRLEMEAEIKTLESEILALEQKRANGPSEAERMANLSHEEIHLEIEKRCADLRKIKEALPTLQGKKEIEALTEISDAQREIELLRRRLRYHSSNTAIQGFVSRWAR